MCTRKTMTSYSNSGLNIITNQSYTYLLIIWWFYLKMLIQILKSQWTSVFQEIDKMLFVLVYKELSSIVLPFGQSISSLLSTQSCFPSHLSLSEIQRPLWQRNEDSRYVLHSEGKNKDTLTTERRHSVWVTFWRKKHRQSDNGTKTVGMCYILKEKTQTLWQRNEDSRYVLLSEELKHRHSDNGTNTFGTCYFLTNKNTDTLTT